MIVRAVVAGAGGRMGRQILHALRGDAGFEIVGATERPGSPHLGHDAGQLSAQGPLDVPISGSLEAALARPADVVIDFTAPAATLQHAKVCAERGVALVVGTTGLSLEQKAELVAAAVRMPLVLASNMSVAVNVLFRLVSEAARALGPGYEVEIVELHHRMKRDAPSGTALGLVERAADALGLDPQRAMVAARQGDVGPRQPGTIGVQALRGGDVVGEHTVLFLGDGERLELTHKASNRDNFARGAVRAARWVADKPPGLYDMQDVLGFRENAP